MHFLGSSGSRVETKLELGYVEEELYVKGNVVIWSKGLINNVNDFDHPKTTICAYSSQHPIRQAIWCTFHDQRPALETDLDNQNQQNTVENKIPAICVVDTESIRVFTADNEDFISSVAFQVSNLWNTKYGIFLEKQKDGKHTKSLICCCEHCCIAEENSPKLFSLAHPLEEAYPVAVKESSLSLIDNSNLQIVFTKEDPSIAVVYNSQSGNHCVYHIRQLKPGEWVEKTEKTTTAHSSINTSSKVSC